MSVRFVAHLSDLHILGRGKHALADRLVSVGRSLDPAGRISKLARALEHARRRGAKHVVISGDLTETGAPDQFETLAEVLHGSAWTPDEVTLVPGNHDAYTNPDGWRKALAGPLAEFAKSSAHLPGQVVDRGDVVFLPVDVSRFQNIALSGGTISDEAIATLEKRLDDASFGSRAVVLVQHHPPFPSGGGVWGFIDGLRGAHRLVATLARYPHLAVLHGHLHRAVDRILASVRPRVFCAPATVGDPEHVPRVRLYEVKCGQLEVVSAV